MLHGIYVQFKMQEKKSHLPRSHESGTIRLPKAALKPLSPCTGKSQAPTTGMRLWGVGGLGCESKAALQGGSKNLQKPHGQGHWPSSEWGGSTDSSWVSPCQGQEPPPTPESPSTLPLPQKRYQSGYSHSKDLVFISICPAITVLSQNQKKKKNPTS